MRKYGKVSPRIWTGRLGRLMHGRPDMQTLVMYLITNQHQNLVGIYRLPIAYAETDTGLSRGSISKLLEELEEFGFVKCDTDTSTVWVVDHVRHELGGKASKPQTIAVSRVLEEFDSSFLVQDFAETYPEYLPDGYSVDSLSIACRPPEQKQEQKQEQKAGTGERPGARKQRAPADVYSDEEFRRFWSAYPKKLNKGEAAKAWAQTDPMTNGEYVKRPEDLEKVLKAISMRCKSAEWKEQGGKYIPNPATWLRAAGWDDCEGDPKTCRDCGRESESPEGFQPYGLCLPCSQKPEHRPHGCPHLSGGRWDSTREKFLPDDEWEAEFGTPPPGDTQQVMAAFHRGEMPPNPKPGRHQVSN